MKSVVVLSVWHNEQKKPWHVLYEKTRQAFAVTTSPSLDESSWSTITSQSSVEGLGF